MQRDVNYRLIIKSALIVAAIFVLMIIAGRIFHSIAMARVLPQARELIADEKYDKALELLQAYLREHPSNREVLHDYAELLEKVKRPQHAAEIYRRLLQLEPANTETLRWLVEFEAAHAERQSLREPATARTHYTEAERLSKQLLELLAKQGVQPEIKDLRHMAATQAGLNENDAAKSTLDKMIELYPEEQEGYFRLAELLRRTGEPLDEWRKVILQAMENVPESASLHLSAHYALSEQVPEAAAVHLARAKELAPEEHDVILACALAEEREAHKSRQQNDEDAAEAHIQAAMEHWRKLQQENPEKYLPYSAQARLHLLRADTQAALEMLDAGIDAVTDDGLTTLRQQKIELFLNKRQFEEAREELSILRMDTPGTPVMAFLEGRLLLAEGKPHDARILLENAARAMPNLPQVHLLLGRARLETGEPGLARTSLQTSLSMRNDSSEARLLLINAFLQTGEPQQAIREAQRLTQDQPGLQQAYIGLAHAIMADTAANAPPEQLDRAIAAAEKAVEISPNANSLQLLAHLQSAAQQYQLAEQTLKTQPADPADARPLKTALMHFYHSTGRIDEARETYQQIIEQYGSEPAFEIAAAKLFESPGKTEEILLGQLENADPQQAPAIHNQLVSCYIEQNQYENAARHLEAIAQAQPQNSNVRRMQMRLAMETGEREGARKYLKQLSLIEGEDSPEYASDKAEFVLPEADSTQAAEIARELERAINLLPSARAYTLLADARRIQKNFAEAIRNYEHALQADPNTIKAGVSLVETLEEAGRPNDARNRLERLLQAQPMSPILLDMQLERLLRDQDISGSIAMLDRKLQLHPENIESLLLMGNLQINAGNINEAEKYLRKAYSLDTHSPATVSAITQFLAGTARMQEAEEIADELISEIPEDSRSYLVRAQLYRANGRHGKAIEDLNKILEITPDDKQTIVLIGDIHNELGRRETAFEFYRRAAALEPPGTAVRTMLARRLSTGTKQQLTEAVGIVDKILKEQPDDAQAHLLKASLLVNPDTLETAKQHCRRAIQLAPGKAAPFVQLAQLYMAENDLLRAEELVREALIAEPRHNQAIMVHAEILKRQGAYARAAVILDRTTSSPQVILVRAGILEAERGLPAAINYLEEQLAAYENPAGTAIRLRLANALERIGRTEQALQHMRVVYESTGTALYLGALARMLDRQERYEETDALLAQTGEEAKIDAGEIKLLKAELMLVRSRSQEDIQTAHRYLQELVVEQPENSHVFSLLGYVYHSRGNIRQALQYYQKAHELAPRDAAIANNLAWFLAKAARPEEALPLARMAVFQVQTEANFHDTLGEIYYQLKRYEEAEHAFAEAVKHSPGTAPMLFRLGRTGYTLAKADEDEQRRLDKLAQTRRVLEQALELDSRAGLTDEDTQSARTMLQEIEEMQE